MRRSRAKGAASRDHCILVEQIDLLHGMLKSLTSTIENLSDKVDLATGGLALLAERHLDSLGSSKVVRDYDGPVPAEKSYVQCVAPCEPESEMSPTKVPPGLVMQDAVPFSSRVPCRGSENEHPQKFDVPKFDIFSEPDEDVSHEMPAVDVIFENDPWAKHAPVMQRTASQSEQLSTACPVMEAATQTEMECDTVDVGTVTDPSPLYPVVKKEMTDARRIVAESNGNKADIIEVVKRSFRLLNVDPGISDIEFMLGGNMRCELVVKCRDSGLALGEKGTTIKQATRILEEAIGVTSLAVFVART